MGVGQTLVLSGSTGCGKSELALALAERFNGEIVNADSVQLYKGHHIGAAAPEPKSMEKVPHHLYGVIPGNKSFDAKQYVELATQSVAGIRDRGRLPIVVGGSTLYLEALLHGLAELPAADEQLRGQLEKKKTAELFRDLEGLDPKRATELHPNDRVRILRSLEVSLLTGVPFSEQSSKRGPSPLSGNVLTIVPLWSRATLYERIDSRSRKMVQSGLIEETGALYQQFGEEWQCRGALGYQQTLAAILRDGEERIDREALVSEIAQFTRRYAKRQMTYWRNAPKKFAMDFEPKEAAQGVEQRGEERTDRGKPKEERKGFLAFHQSFEELVLAVLARFDSYDERQVENEGGNTRAVMFSTAEGLGLQ
ncbi:MAG: tRNA (adenosine(37)-N6)-dimethylallyltransferase MiaA [Bdellovibrionales bacterium]|nr:tRNA (adenosine(37)-N6)-dimethylallyltransferase MiaA [Bdellovibrionales bacterium]